MWKELPCRDWQQAAARGGSERSSQLRRGPAADRGSFSWVQGSAQLRSSAPARAHQRHTATATAGASYSDAPVAPALQTQPSSATAPQRLRPRRAPEGGQLAGERLGPGGRGRRPLPRCRRRAAPFLRAAGGEMAALLRRAAAGNVGVGQAGGAGGGGAGRGLRCCLRYGAPEWRRRRRRQPLPAGAGRAATAGPPLPAAGCGSGPEAVPKNVTGYNRTIPFVN